MVKWCRKTASMYHAHIVTIAIAAWFEFHRHALALVRTAHALVVALNANVIRATNIVSTLIGLSDQTSDRLASVVSIAMDWFRLRVGFKSTMVTQSQRHITSPTT